MTQLQLYGIEQSVYCKIVTLVLRLKGVSFRHVETNIFLGGDTEEKYSTLNPFKKIPTLIHGEFSLYEVSAISSYIDEVFSVKELQPASPRHKARMNQIISVMDSYAYQPMVWGIYVECSVKPSKGEQPDKTLVNKSIEEAKTCLDVLTTFLAEKSYFIGDKPSLADCHVYPMLECLEKCAEGKHLLDAYKNLEQWQLRMKIHTGNL
jgi:glutathione S-transferase